MREQKGMKAVMSAVSGSVGTFKVHAERWVIDGPPLGKIGSRGEELNVRSEATLTMFGNDACVLPSEDPEDIVWAES